MAATPIAGHRIRKTPEFLMHQFTEIASQHLHKFTSKDDLVMFEPPAASGGTSATAPPDLLRRAVFSFSEEDPFFKIPPLLVPEHDEDHKEIEPIPKPIPAEFDLKNLFNLSIEFIPSFDVFGLETNFIGRKLESLFGNGYKHPSKARSKWEDAQSELKSPEIISEDLKLKNPVWRFAYEKRKNDLERVDTIGCKKYMKENAGFWHNKTFSELHKCSANGLDNECLYCPGSYGENILHKLVLWLITSTEESDKEDFFAIIKYILKKEHHRRRLINSIYEEKEYYGETALHLVIAHPRATTDIMRNGELTPEEDRAIRYLCRKKFDNQYDVDKEEEIETKLPIESRLLIYLLERGADPHVTCADGNFFSTENPQYVAGSILGMATRLGNRFAMELLMSYSRADPNVSDTKGNTPLHILAWFGIHDWQTALAQELSLPFSSFHGIYRATPEGILGVNRKVKPPAITMDGPWVILKKYGAYRNQKNRRYQTPLILALYKKHSTMANLIIEDTKIRRWTWAGISGSLYDLNALEPPNIHKMISIRNRIEETALFFRELYRDIQKKEVIEDIYRREIKHNALEIIIRSEDYHSLLMIPVLQILLEAKWKLYARGMYITNFVATALYMVVFTINLFVLLPMGPNSELGSKRVTYTGNTWRLILELILLLGTCATVTLKFIEYTKYGLLSLFWNGFNPYQNWLLLFWNVTFFVNVGFRFSKSADSENVCWSLLALLGWMRILHHAQGLRTVGPLVNIFIHVIRKDFLERFLLIYAVIYVAFTQAIWMQMSNLTTADKPSVQDIWAYPISSMLRVWEYQVDQNDNQIPDFKLSKFPAFTIILYSLYIFTTFVLLINLLIALLSNTFTKTAEYTDRLWLLRWANLILDLEHQMSFEELKRYRATLGMAVDLVTQDGRKLTGRFFWISTIPGPDGQPIPTKITTNEVEKYNIGPKILKSAGKRFTSETWQISVDEQKLKKVEKVIGGKRVPH
ncbi:hypothetical protein HK098_003957 [Nowakowskiella sp. JEL0407]|nr:hypothetical protein HK098_003957 [Nowakowskiella sp. JEL0407]